MTNETQPKGPGVSASNDHGVRELAETLAAALCELEDELEAGNVLFVTRGDGVQQDKLDGARLDALLEQVIGSKARKRKPRS